jgi:hypothetical protein
LHSISIVNFARITDVDALLGRLGHRRASIKSKT